jgi:hypothetical protein
MNGIRLLVVIVLGLLLSDVSLAAKKLPVKYSDKELVKILRDDGYRAVEISEDRVIKIRVDGQEFALLVYDDNDLQLYYGLTGYSISAEAINTWNKTRRLSRAYLDDDRDPILETDLLANAGITPKQITEWLDVFLDSATQFRLFLGENDQSE